MNKILVTGAGGYIGSVLSKLLLKKGYTVYGLDCLLFTDKAIKRLKKNKRFKFVKADINFPDSYQDVLDQVDSIVHLAAIVGDPACSKNPKLATETNWLSSKKLFNFAKSKKNIKRFIFSSTCSNYGKMADKYVDETSALNPISLYAELKVKFETYILKSKTRSDFFPTALRFATAYGLSPRMRFVLTVNEFARDIALDKELVVYGEQFWRPYCHTTDIATACKTILEADPKIINHEVFNVGNTKENYTKKDIVKLLFKKKPKAKISFVKKDEDPRDYRVNFDKIKRLLNYRTSHTVPKGIDELFEALSKDQFPDPFSKEYSNI